MFVAGLAAGCAGDPGGAGTGADGSGSFTESADGTASASAEGSGDGDGEAEGSGDGDGDAEGGTTKWDVKAIPDVDESCDQKCGGGGFSYIYIANSNQSTMSKINTETLIEEGRYLTRSGGGGSPSRTSVSIDGQMGSINNRQVGGVLTVWAVPELCDPNKNGQPGVQTSSGAMDVLAWGEDDCVAWFTDIAGAMRPIAWIAGAYNEQTCTYDQQKLWTATSSNVTAYRLNRDTGQIEDSTAVPGVAFGYGGASDAEGNFWIVSLGTDLGRVDNEDLSVQKWTIPHSVYAVTVASDGRVWMSANMSQTTSAIRFDPETEQFDLATGPVAYAQSGIAEDAEGRMWMNHWQSPYSIYPIDKETMVTGAPFIVQGATSSAKGVSVDKDGNVWTAHFDNRAYRMAVDDNIVDQVTGLDYPYTYSDMTGGALTGVTCGSPTG
jgi:sugar lactone lactonase YvrE